MNAVGMNRIEYYLFLRKVYKMYAWEAWDYMKRMGLPPNVGTLRKAIRGREL